MTGFFSIFQKADFIEAPPSTGKMTPVMNGSFAKNAAVRAHSSVFPVLPIGCAFPTTSKNALNESPPLNPIPSRLRSKSVSTTP